MKLSDSGRYQFENDGKQIHFEDDMHDFAIMCDNGSRKHILFPNYQLAKQESDRLNDLNIKDLDTRHLGNPLENHVGHLAG